MKSILSILFLIFALSSEAATVTCTNLIDSFGSIYSNFNAVVFVPQSRQAQPYGVSTVLPVPVRTPVTNGSFSSNIKAGGFYSMFFYPANQSVPPQTILIPTADTNIYTLNFVLNLATNLNTISWGYFYLYANTSLTNLPITTNLVSGNGFGGVQDSGLPISFVLTNVTTSNSATVTFTGQGTKLSPLQATATGTGTGGNTTLTSTNGSASFTASPNAFGGTNFDVSIPAAISQAALSSQLIASNYQNLAQLTAVFQANSNLSYVLGLNGTNYSQSVFQASSNLSYALALANSNAATAIFQAGSNLTYAIAQSNTNHANGVFQSSSNLSYTLALACSNQATVIYQASSNLSYTLGLNGSNNVSSSVNAAFQSATNYANGVFQASSNLSYQLGVYGTNYANGVFQASSNLTYLLGASGTNLTLAAWQSASNLSYVIGLNGTNYANGVFQNGSNLTYSVAQMGTNNSINISNYLEYVKAQIGMNTNFLVVSGAGSALANGTNVWQSATCWTNLNGSSYVTNTGSGSIWYIYVAGASFYGSTTMQPISKGVGWYVTGGSPAPPSTAFLPNVLTAGANISIASSYGVQTVSASTTGVAGITTVYATNSGPPLITQTTNLWVNTNYDGLGAAVVAFQSNSNLSYALALLSTNYANVVFQAGSNLSYTLAQACSNQATAIFQASSNLSYVLGQNGTNYANAVFQNSSNISYTLALNNSNSAIAIYQANSNLSYVIGLNGTNFTTATSNGLYSIFTAGTLNSGNVYTNLNIAGSSFVQLNTNNIVIGGTTPEVSSQFFWLSSGNKYTNSVTGDWITNNTGTGFYILNNSAGVSQFFSPTLINAWAVINGSGTCISGYGGSMDFAKNGISLTNISSTGGATLGGSFSVSGGTISTGGGQPIGVGDINSGGGVTISSNLVIHTPGNATLQGGNLTVQGTGLFKSQVNANQFYSTNGYFGGTTNDINGVAQNLSVSISGGSYVGGQYGGSTNGSVNSIQGSVVGGCYAYATSFSISASFGTVFLGDISNSTNFQSILDSGTHNCIDANSSRNDSFTGFFGSILDGHYLRTTNFVVTAYNSIINFEATGCTNVNLTLQSCYLSGTPPSNYTNSMTNVIGFFSSGVLYANSNGNFYATSFNGNGGGLTNINATNLTQSLAVFVGFQTNWVQNQYYTNNYPGWSSVVFTQHYTNGTSTGTCGFRFLCDPAGGHSWITNGSAVQTDVTSMLGSGGDIPFNQPVSNGWTFIISNFTTVGSAGILQPGYFKSP